MTRTVYALSASDEPLQVRYVGATTLPLAKRLLGHPHDKVNKRKLEWLLTVKERGATVNIRTLSEHVTDDELYDAEHRWMRFWAEYCDLLNLDFTDRRCGGRRKVTPEIIRTTIPLHELVRRIRARD